MSLLPRVLFVQKNLSSNPQTCKDDWEHLDNKVLIFDKKTLIEGPALLFILFPTEYLEKYHINKRT